VYADTCYQNFLQLGKQQYPKKNEKIRCLVLKEGLLEYNVKWDWKPLCKLLGQDVPDEPFPRRNNTAEFNALMAYLRIF